MNNPSVPCFKRVRNRKRPCSHCGAKAGKPCKKGCLLRMKLAVAGFSE